MTSFTLSYLLVVSHPQIYSQGKLNLQHMNLGEIQFN